MIVSLLLPPACFVRLEDHCSSLQTSRGQLERLWEEKGTQLDKVLQLRLFEHDAEQLSKWIVHEGNSLAREHTDIGDTSTAAEMRRQSFEDFRNRLKVCSGAAVSVHVFPEPAYSSTLTDDVCCCLSLSPSDEASGVV